MYAVYATTSLYILSNEIRAELGANNTTEDKI